MSAPTSAYAARDTGHPLLAQLLPRLLAWVSACADACAVARMYEQQRRLSDAELKRRGLSRETLARDLWRMREEGRQNSQSGE